MCRTRNVGKGPGVHALHAQGQSGLTPALRDSRTSTSTQKQTVNRGPYYSTLEMLPLSYTHSLASYVGRDRIFIFWVLRPYLAVFGAYSWLCAQTSILVEPGGTCGMSEWSQTSPCRSALPAIPLPAVPSLRPLNLENFIFKVESLNLEPFGVGVWSVGF